MQILRLSLVLFAALAISSLACALAAEEGESKGATGGLRSEEDVAKLRDEAIAKLEKPLEKMKVKELKQLLTDRGVVCTACSEKDQLVKTVRESIHLPIKKDHLKKLHVPKQMADDEMNEVLKMIKNKQQKEKDIRKMLEDQGIPTDGIHFGSDNMGADDIERILKKTKKGGGKKDL